MVGLAAASVFRVRDRDKVRVRVVYKIPYRRARLAYAECAREQRYLAGLGLGLWLELGLVFKLGLGLGLGLGSGLGLVLYTIYPLVARVLGVVRWLFSL